MKFFPVVIVFLGFYTSAAMNLIQIQECKTPAAAIKQLKNTTDFCADPAMVGTVAIKLHERFYDEGMTEAEAVAWIDTPQADAWFYQYLKDQGQRRHSWQWIKKQGVKIVKTMKRDIRGGQWPEVAMRQAAGQFKLLFSSYQRGPKIMRAKMDTLIECLARTKYDFTAKLSVAAYLNVPGSVKYINDQQCDLHDIGYSRQQLAMFYQEKDKSAIAAMERAGVEWVQ